MRQLLFILNMLLFSTSYAALDKPIEDLLQLIENFQGSPEDMCKEGGIFTKSIRSDSGELCKNDFVAAFSLFLCASKNYYSFTRNAKLESSQCYDNAIFALSLGNYDINREFSDEKVLGDKTMPILIDKIFIEGKKLDFTNDQKKAICNALKKEYTTSTRRYEGLRLSCFNL